ncbi:MAG: hypothetical protein CVT61_03200 [Actinobacteria bacterium HGW-Actinobacteria-11]|nr:MAG: hypothetical protein CVT61_03200 [Actinobacteria bacterium HGW-Actinobacteria-11]
MDPAFAPAIREKSFRTRGEGRGRGGEGVRAAGGREDGRRDGRQGGREEGGREGCKGSGDAKGARIRRSSPLSAVC